MILFNGNSKKKYCKAHTAKSILSFKSLNSGSQMPLLNFVSWKARGMQVQFLAFFCYWRSLIEYIALLSTESVSKLIEINGFH